MDKKKPHTVLGLHEGGRTIRSFFPKVEVKGEWREGREIGEGIFEVKFEEEITAK